MKVATHFLQEYIPTNESQSVRSLLKPKTDAEVLQKLQSATQEEKDAALIDAAKSGDAKAVELLLAAGADVNADNDEALRRAADRGRTEVVKVLLAAGADVHANDDYALRGAAYEGHIEVVELLLAAGADVHTIGGQALRLAAMRGHTRVVKLLKQYMGLTEAQSVLSLLRPKTEAEVLQKLDTATQEQKDEALTDAAASGDARGVQLLLAAGADVNVDNGWGLSLAARWGHIEVVRLLLAAGADVHAREDMSLRYATERGRTEVVKLLQQHMKTL